MGLNVLAVQAHRATTRHAAAVYLWQADPALATTGPLLGVAAHGGSPFRFDPFALYQAGVLTNPNLVIVGQVGAGKSTVAKLLCWTQAVLAGRRVAIVDPKGEYGPLAGLLGLTTVRLAPGGAQHINPLDAPTGRDDEGAERRRAGMAAALASSGLGRPLRADERAAIAAAADHLRPPFLLGRLVEGLLRPDAAAAAGLGMTAGELAGAGREAALELRRLVLGDLAGMFDSPTNVALDPHGPGLHVDLSAVYANPAVLAPTMVAAGSWLAQRLATPGAQHLVVLDETWQVLADPGVGRWLRSTMKLARSLGAAVALVTHTVGDFDTVGAAGSDAARLAGSLLADTATRVILAQPAAGAARTAEALGLNHTETAVAGRLRRGQAIWKIGDYRAVINHTVSAYLAAATDTDTAMRPPPDGPGRP